MENETITYKSTQATNCAGCGEHKHTPLRNDEMGGYVCLTCIDKELERLQELERSIIST
jgi:formylmethanofuran dehydrogenase subunit E